MNTVYQAFVHAAENYPDNDFLHIPASACASYSKNAITYSYAQFGELVNTSKEQYTAAGLGARLLEPGQTVLRVALLLENRPEFFQHFFALNALGVSVVPVNSEMQPNEQAYLLEHSEAELLICLPERCENIKAALALC